MKKLSVIGCGSVGDALLEAIALKHLEYKLKYEIIEFIDPDIVSKDSSKYFQYPKVFEIEDKLNNINPFMKLRPIQNTFPECLQDLNKHVINNTLYIDCRDDLIQSSICYMKIYSDGPYGHIIKYPDDKIDSKPTNYQIKRSNYYAKLTVYRVVEDILRSEPIFDHSTQQKEYIINHMATI